MARALLQCGTRVEAKTQDDMPKASLCANLTDSRSFCSAHGPEAVIYSRNNNGTRQNGLGQKQQSKAIRPT